MPISTGCAQRTSTQAGKPAGPEPVYVPGAAHVAAGTFDFGDAVRIVRVNDFYLEAVPSGYILILQNKDVPGVVGAFITALYVLRAVRTIFLGPAPASGGPRRRR